MGTILSFNDPERLAAKLGAKARQLRLEANLSRKTLAQRSGVPESTIKHFETTGQVSLGGLLRIAWVLDRLDEFAALLEPRPAPSLEALRKPRRERGRT